MSIKKIEIVVQHDIHSSNIVLSNAKFISSNSILAYVCIERRTHMWIDFVNWFLADRMYVVIFMFDIEWHLFL